MGVNVALALAFAAWLDGAPASPSPGVSPSPTTRPSPSAAPHVARGFTVREYRIYRSVATAPSFMTEAEVLKRAARQFEISTTQAKRVSDRVQALLLKNRWFGPPENEIRHASDWKGEKP
jgi:hypothetical protein